MAGLELLHRLQNEDQHEQPDALRVGSISHEQPGARAPLALTLA